MTLTLLEALSAPRPSTRLQAALTAGTRPDQRTLDALVARCAIEPDFFVRDMLTWAITRHAPGLTVPRLIHELGSANPQARSQALHTLSKIGDRRAWPAIGVRLLHDPDDEVARSAWRAAVVLVPGEERAALAATLATELGRGDRATQLSLSRALIALDEDAAPMLAAARSDPDPRTRTHAVATEQLMADPDAGFAYAIDEARRIVALGPDTGTEKETGTDTGHPDAGQ